jgi:hypothetical protein
LLRIPFHKPLEVPAVGGPIDQKELEAKIKALESRFRPYLARAQQDAAASLGDGA